MSRTHAELKSRQRAERHTHAEGLKFRVHRALSWLERAEMEAGAAETPGDGDPDAQFIFLWIAFNAAYATEITDAHRDGEQSAFNAFLGVLLDLDGQNRLSDLVWKQFPGPIRGLLDNKFLYRDFWNAHNGRRRPGSRVSRRPRRTRARRSVAATPSRCSASPSTASTPSATSWCTAAAPGTARSTVSRCATARASWRRSSP